eukprot:5283224-Amphidinium_carterae.2
MRIHDAVTLRFHEWPASHEDKAEAPKRPPHKCHFHLTKTMSGLCGQRLGPSNAMNSYELIPGITVSMSAWHATTRTLCAH